MNKLDFKFTEYNPEYEDYWFEVSGDSKTELTDKYMDQSMVTVTDVIYSTMDNVVAVKRLFPFSYDVVEADDGELKNVLVELVAEVNTKR